MKAPVKRLKMIESVHGHLWNWKNLDEPLSIPNEIVSNHHGVTQ